MAQVFAILMLLLGSGMITARYFVRIDEVVTTTGQLKSVDEMMLKHQQTERFQKFM